MLKARVIKSKDCPRCAAYLARLTQLKFPHIVYDVADGSKEDLDKWRINDMPIVQLVDTETSEVHFQFKYVQQGWSPRAIKHKIKEKEKEMS